MLDGPASNEALATEIALGLDRELIIENLFGICRDL